MAPDRPSFPAWVRIDVEANWPHRQSPTEIKAPRDVRRLRHRRRTKPGLRASLSVMDDLSRHASLYRREFQAKADDGLLNDLIYPFSVDSEVSDVLIRPEKGGR
jgi:hypothetical protein